MSMRKNILALSLFEAAKLLQEQEAPPAPAPTPDPAAATPSAAPVGPGAFGGEVPTDDETGEALTLDHILERLNTIRSGKSFQDPEVYGQLTTLYKNMPAEDKIKLNKQLKAIGSIVQNIPSKEGGTKAGPEGGEAIAAPETAPPAVAPTTPPAPAA